MSARHEGSGSGVVTKAVDRREGGVRCARLHFLCDVGRDQGVRITDSDCGLRKRSNTLTETASRYDKRGSYRNATLSKPV